MIPLLPLQAANAILEHSFGTVLNEAMAYLEQLYLWQCFWPPYQYEWRYRDRGPWFLPADAPDLDQTSIQLATIAFRRLRDERNASLKRLLQMALVCREWYAVIAEEIGQSEGHIHHLAPLRFPLSAEGKKGLSLLQNCRGYHVEMDRALHHLLTKLDHDRCPPYAIPAIAAEEMGSGVHLFHRAIGRRCLKEIQVASPPSPQWLWLAFAAQYFGVQQRDGQWAAFSITATPFNMTDIQWPSMSNGMKWAAALQTAAWGEGAARDQAGPYPYGATIRGLESVDIKGLPAPRFCMILALPR